MSVSFEAFKEKCSFTCSKHSSCAFFSLTRAHHRCRRIVFKISRVQKYLFVGGFRPGHAPTDSMETNESLQPCRLLGNPDLASGAVEPLGRGAVHVCHVCTTCHDRNNGPNATSVPDIEGISGLNSGAIVFHMLHSALTEPGVGCWKESEEAVAGGSTARAIDAGHDERVKPRFLCLKSDPNVKLKLAPVRCLSLCGAPHVIALRGGPDKFVYQFGGINREELAGLVDMITSFCTSTDGYSSTRTRPQSLRGKISARVPPLNGRVVAM